jgi:hypothetical protein
MATLTGPGRVERRTRPDGILLFNFDVDGAQLKPEHEKVLRTEVAPTLRSGGSLSVVGLASRSGKAGHNEALSLRRARAVLGYLERMIPQRFPVRTLSGFGERKAAAEGYRDGVEDERFRSVLVLVSSTSVPPRAPDVVELDGPAAPVAPGDGALDTLGKVLDSVGFGIDLLGLFASGVTIAVLEALSPVLGIVSAGLALPAAWLAGDRLARFNGFCQGFWNAMQDMANGFSDPALPTRPESQWPPVPVPRVHPSADPVVSEAQRAWRAGEEAGCRHAYETILKMERNPPVHSLTVNGRRIKLRTSGRLYLALLYRAQRRDVARAIRAGFNRRFREQGRSDWPLYK